MSRSRFAPAAAFVAAAVLGAVAADECFGGRARGKPGRDVARLEIGEVAPPGAAPGLAAGDGTIVIPFTLVDGRRRRADVEVQFGADWNQDGIVWADEYRPATEDRLDPRNTRREQRPTLWETTGGIGAAHAFAWYSLSYADLGPGRYLRSRFKVTDQGRYIRDLAHPGEFLYDDAQGGVRVRMRAARRAGRRLYVGPWIYSAGFSADNNRAPSMTIDSRTVRGDGAMDLRWTAISPMSEDTNGNGVDDDLDLNGDGQFNQVQVGVAFDWYVLQPGEDPAAMTQDQIDRLVWVPCTRLAGEGDTDSFRELAAQGVFGSPGGRQWTFVWDAEGDAGWLRGNQAILRARPIDQAHSHGPWAYVLTPFTL